MKTVLHVSLTLSLLFIGEYTTLLLLQLALLFLYNKFFYYFYLPFVHFVLLKLFGSLLYPLYFFALAMVIYTIYKEQKSISKENVGMLSLVYILLFALYSNFKEKLYDLYIELDINDTVHYISADVVYALTLLHLFIFFFLTFEYNDKKLFRK